MLQSLKTYILQKNDFNVQLSTFLLVKEIDNTNTAYEK